MTGIKQECITHTNEDGSTEQNFLMTYSAEEKQNNEINKANASLVFSPEFIPYYPAIRRQYGLTYPETVLYGFIRYYLSCNESGRFYFTNEQLSKILECDAKTISRAVNKLEEIKIITTSRKIRNGGGQIRFIKEYNPTGQNVVLQKDKNGMSNGTISVCQTGQKRYGNKKYINTLNNLSNNKIKDISIYSDSTISKEKQPTYETYFDMLWEKYPAKDGKKAAYKFFRASVKTSQDWQDINTALNNYLQSERVRNGYVKNGSTWFNNWKDWIEYRGDTAETEQQMIARLKRQYGE